MSVGALLRKDVRLNGLVLAFGAVALLGPFLLGITHHSYCVWRYGVADWSYWRLMSLSSLLLSMFTIVMLGASAFAAERADRSAEFLAYLPPSRRAHAVSKAIVVLGAAGVIWLVNLLAIYVLGPYVEGMSWAETLQAYERLGDVLPVFGATSVMLLGVSWFFSSFGPSHALATALGIGAPVVVGVPLGMIDEFYHPPGFDFQMWYNAICTAAGSAGFIGGIICYLRRVEP